MKITHRIAVVTPLAGGLSIGVVGTASATPRGSPERSVAGRDLPDVHARALGLCLLSDRDLIHLTCDALFRTEASTINQLKPDVWRKR